ncbi:MAG TPA: GerMN domain-containing protein [Acidimicrobiales bacterium]|nr:GerMN domain-containing protein [Acidimicrobiales bacterium]
MPKPLRLCVVMFAAAFAACGVTTQASPRVVDRRSVPFDLLKKNARPLVATTTPQAAEPVALCFVQDQRLVTVERSLESPVALRDVVNALAESPADVPRLRTAFGGPDLVDRVELRGGVVAVDLTPEVSTLGGNDQLLAIAQVVCSLTARPGVGQVTFTLGGAPVDVPRADGTVTSEPVSRDDYASLL